MSFASIPNRTNVTRILREWFDNLRDAGAALESWLGSFSGPTTFTISDAQTTADVTGLLLVSGSYHKALIEISVLRTRTSAASGKAQYLQFIAVYEPVAAQWTMDALNASGVDAGVTFNMTTAGQMQYTSDTPSGTPSINKIQYRMTTMGVLS